MRRVRCMVIDQWCDLTVLVLGRDGLDPQIKVSPSLGDHSGEVKIKKIQLFYDKELRKYLRLKV